MTPLQMPALGLLFGSMQLQRSSALQWQIPAALPLVEAAPQSLPFTLIIGLPRSGTSWIGKIFDSHPRVIYRHEPDHRLATTGFFPWICPREEAWRHAEAARRYIARLTTVRNVRSSGHLPIFTKPFQPWPMPHIRRALAIAIRVSEAAAPKTGWPADWLARARIPDFTRRDARGIAYVLKSINLLGATPLLAEALPESRIIAVLRHPCGHIASLKRGFSLGVMKSSYGSDVLATRRARELRLTPEAYETLPATEQWMWEWALLTANLLEEVHDLPNVRLFRYEDICREPMRQARELIAFAGLPWAEEVARFVEKSTKCSPHERYFSVFRDPNAAATKWRQELSADEIKRCMDVVHTVLPDMSFEHDDGHVVKPADDAEGRQHDGALPGRCPAVPEIGGDEYLENPTGTRSAPRPQLEFIPDAPG